MRINKIKIREFLKVSGVEVNRVLLLGIRMDNDVNTYDDYAIIVYPDRMNIYPFNTNPSKRIDGMATLVPGVWSFIAGKHKLSSPRGYSAFRQYGYVTVDRHNRGKDTGYFGINLHRGGSSGTSSEGCQTLPPQVWGEFRFELYKALGTTDLEVMNKPSGVPGTTFRYFLTTREDIINKVGAFLESE
jgi:hypothetical protein